VAASDPQKTREREADQSRGYCPVCGAEVLWTPTAQLWPTKRSSQSVLPSQSGTCGRCHRELVFTVVYDPATDADRPTS
jgi:hypothetical protein